MVHAAVERGCVVTAAPKAALGIRTIAAVTVTPFEDKGELVDRRIQVLLSCGCTRDRALPLNARLPRVGEIARCWGQHP